MVSQSSLDPESVVIVRPQDAHCAILATTEDGSQIEISLSEAATTELVDKLLEFQPDVPEPDTGPNAPTPPTHQSQSYSQSE